MRRERQEDEKKKTIQNHADRASHSKRGGDRRRCNLTI